jgi:hypothetical protein
MTTIEKKAMKAAKARIAKMVKLGTELSIPYILQAHELAIEYDAALMQALLSHKEVCAQRRASAYDVTSIFTHSINPGSSAYNIEVLLTEFRTENELVKLMNEDAMLVKCNTLQVKRSRVRSHLSHLKRKFSQTVRYIEKIEGRLVYFKFELK